MGKRKRDSPDKRSSKPEQQLRRWLPGLEDSTTRQQAVQALTELGEPAVGPLARVMREGDLNTSQAAARALTQIGAPAVNILCELLGDDDWNVSQSAALALVRIGAPAVEPLCRALASPNPIVPHLAVMALTKIRKPACDGLCRALGNPQPEVRSQARTSLIKMGSTAIPTLTRAFHQPEKYAPTDRREATLEAGSLREAIRIEAADVLCGIGGSALDVLCGALGSSDASLQQVAVAALEQNKTRAVEALSRFLLASAAHSNPAPDSAMQGAVLAAALLGRMGRVRAHGALVQALDSRDERVRVSAARALGELAKETRSPELRMHLSQLRRRLRAKARESEEGSTLERAIQAIEATTHGIASMPLPSASLAPEKDDLPRAAAPAGSDARTLPIAAEADEAAGVSDGPTWWSRLARRFRDTS